MILPQNVKVEMYKCMSNLWYVQYSTVNRHSPCKLNCNGSTHYCYCWWLALTVKWTDKVASRGAESWLVWHAAHPGVSRDQTKSKYKEGRTSYGALLPLPCPPSSCMWLRLSNFSYMVLQPHLICWQGFAMHSDNGGVIVIRSHIQVKSWDNWWQWKAG